MADAGTLLASRYRLDRRTVPGGIVEAWQASDLTTGRPVSVRLLRTARAAQAERFLAGAERAARLRHRGIARVHDYGQAGPAGTAFLVSEVVGTFSLAAVMQAGPLDSAWVVEMTGQVASALGAAHHAGLVHQRIKPENVLLGPGGAAKLTDFGLARGSEGRGSDLYCLGLVAWECLTGSRTAPDAPLGRPGPLPPMPAAVPAGVARLVADLTAADPAARPAGAEHVVTRCGQLLAAPLRAARPGLIGCADARLLLDPPAQRPAQLARTRPGN
ncbi:MAG TPA: serine/threonine-protein kinase [Trebonia sp.]|nr:serine/threonine-protein kinase [Trebonia sp.]